MKAVDLKRTISISCQQVITAWYQSQGCNNTLGIVLVCACLFIHFWYVFDIIC